MEEKDGKDVVDTENFEGEHISTFLLTSHKHGMPKLVLLHSYDCKIVILHQLGHCPTSLT
jgi:hypothetical protein